MLKFSGAATVPGVPRARSIAGDPDLPAHTDVVVIGGGLIGCITALNLAERGLSVTLCEKGVIAGEASGRAAGAIEYQFLSPIKMALIARSMELWEKMPARVGADIGYSGQGVVTLFDNEAHAATAAQWLDKAEGLPGVQGRMLPGQEIAKLDPGLAGMNWHSALLQENAAAIEPKLATPAIAEEAMRQGARIIQHCAVNHIVLNSGRIEAVSTERGVIKTPNVVIAGGVWSPRIAKQLGLELPQLMIFAEMISVEPVENGPEIFGMTPAGYFRREPDGGYMFGTATGVIPITPTILKYMRQLMSMPSDTEQEMNPAFNLRTFWRELKLADVMHGKKFSAYESNRIFQPEVVGKTSTDTYEGMCRHISAFRNSRIRERYAGALMTSLDNLGVISGVEKIPGLYLGTGMLYGLTMSAAAGEAIADMITGETPEFDISPYRYERFVDGSQLEFYS